MQKSQKKYTFAVILTILGILLFSSNRSFACGGKDVILLDEPSLLRSSSRTPQLDDVGNLLMHRSEAHISPGQARAIAEKFVRERVPNSPLPLAFRKLESVHGKLVYQFKSEPLENYNGQYHLQKQVTSILQQAVEQPQGSCSILIVNQIPFKTLL
jgi:hypothetical protein